MRGCLEHFGLLIFNLGLEDFSTGLVRSTVGLLDTAGSFSLDFLLLPQLFLSFTNEINDGLLRFFLLSLTSSTSQSSGNSSAPRWLETLGAVSGSVRAPLLFKLSMAS